MTHSFHAFKFLDKKSATSFCEEPHLNWEQLNQIRVRQMVKWSIRNLVRFAHNWDDGIMGSKRHSAKGRGQRVKNSYAMRYALFRVPDSVHGIRKCALLIFIPCTRHKHQASKNPLNFSKL